MLLFFAVCLNLFSARAQLQSKNPDIIHRYLDSALATENISPDTAISYYEKAQSLAIQLKTEQLLKLCFSNYMRLLNHLGKFEEGLSVAQEHIKVATHLKDNELLMISYNEAANEFEYLSDYQSATENYLEALKLANVTDNQVMKQKINNNLSSVFISLKDYPTAYSYSSQAYLIAQEQKDTITIGNCLINMGISELHEKQYIKALGHFTQAEKIGYQIPDMSLVADALSDEGLVYYTRQQLNKALHEYLKEKAIAEQYNLQYQKLYAVFQLAVIAKEKNDYEKANRFTLQAISIGKQLGTPDELMEMYDTMSVIKEKTGNFKEALAYRKKFESLKDSIVNAEIQTNIHHLTIQYRSAQKDKQIAEQNLDIEKTNAQVERKNIWIFIFLAGIVVLTIILLLSFRSYRNHQKLHHQSLLTLQKDHEVNTLKEKMQAREEERDRIAKEMHDDIGSALTTILYLSDDLKIKSLETVQYCADKIAGTASSVVDKMNEIIWSMNSDYDTLDDLISYARQHGVEFLEDHGLQWSLDITEPIPAIQLTGEQRRNIYLCFKESLHNIVKHAAASTVMVKIIIKDRLYISIQDNGRGFDPDQVGRFGNGLKNIAERMESIGGTFSISKEGGGTTVCLLCPLQTDISTV